VRVWSQEAHVGTQEEAYRVVSSRVVSCRVVSCRVLSIKQHQTIQPVIIPPTSVRYPQNQKPVDVTLALPRSRCELIGV